LFQQANDALEEMLAIGDGLRKKNAVMQVQNDHHHFHLFIHQTREKLRKQSLHQAATRHFTSWNCGTACDTKLYHAPPTRNRNTRAGGGSGVRRR
jgi:hypothetical protein